MNYKGIDIVEVTSNLIIANDIVIAIGDRVPANKNFGAIAGDITEDIEVTDIVNIPKFLANREAYQGIEECVGMDNLQEECPIWVLYKRVDDMMEDIVVASIDEFTNGILTNIEGSAI